mmetsp:Transcript_41544/g.119905  ORF Transcript_41544/g.119905 Transcript_41544/m.119905 type:complete len:289 (-) Transcript_41544:13-879(-)
MVGIDARLMRVHASFEKVWDLTENTDAMPGLASVVRKFLVRVEVLPKEAEDLKSLGLPIGEMVHIDPQGRRLVYKWVPRESALGLMTHMQRPGASAASRRNSPSRLKQSMEYIVADEAAECVLPWTPAAVMEVCAEYGAADLEAHFGRSLPELAKELSEGLWFFAVREDGRSLLVVRDVVCALVRSDASRDSVLVVRDGAVAGGGADRTHRLPFRARMADESCATAVSRAIMAELGLVLSSVELHDEDAFQVSPDVGWWKQTPPWDTRGCASVMTRVFVVPALASVGG